MTCPWWQSTLCALDLETTASDPEVARIVTAAIVLCGDGKATVTQTWLADAGGVEIPDEAAAIHGVTSAQARAEGRPAAEVIGEVMAALADRPAGAPIVVYNAKYDLTVLAREARRYGLDPHAWRPGPVVDPFVIDRWLCRFRKGSRKLDATMAHYGATLDDAHEAAADALAAARLAYVIGARGKVVRRVRGRSDAIELAALKREWAAVKDDLDLLHGFQVEKAHEQAVGLRAYFEGKGEHEKAASVQTSWPLVPLPVDVAEAA